MAQRRAAIKLATKQPSLASRGPKKSLGQHWLKDPEILAEIAAAAELAADDVVLEI